METTPLLRRRSKSMPSRGVGRPSVPLKERLERVEAVRQDELQLYRDIATQYKTGQIKLLASGDGKFRFHRVIIDSTIVARIKGTDWSQPNTAAEFNQWLLSNIDDLSKKIANKKAEQGLLPDDSTVAGHTPEQKSKPIFHLDDDDDSPPPAQATAAAAAASAAARDPSLSSVPETTISKKHSEHGSLPETPQHHQFPAPKPTTKASAARAASAAAAAAGAAAQQHAFGTSTETTNSRRSSLSHVSDSHGSTSEQFETPQPSSRQQRAHVDVPSQSSQSSINLLRQYPSDIARFQKHRDVISVSEQAYPVALRLGHAFGLMNRHQLKLNI